MLNLPLVIDEQARTLASLMLRQAVQEAQKKGQNLTRADLRDWRTRSLINAWAMAQNHYHIH